MTVAAAAAAAAAAAGFQEREVREGVGQERLGSPDRDDVGHHHLHHHVHHNQHHGYHPSPHLTSGFFLLIKSRLFSWLTRVARLMKAPVPAHQSSCSDSKSPKSKQIFPTIGTFLQLENLI